MQRIAVFGASGYLGSHVVNAAKAHGFDVVSFVRKSNALSADHFANSTIRYVDISSPTSFYKQLHDCDHVISTVGITRQKDGLRYYDIDYLANKHILQEAQKANIKKFMYVSVFKGSAFTDVKMCAAKEQFVSALTQSNLDYCVIRPTGFFSDMAEFLSMAQNGTVHLIGDGTALINPIHGHDLANMMIASFITNTFETTEVNVGGPHVYSYNTLAKLAFEALRKQPKVRHYPDWLANFMLRSGRLCLSQETFGPYEFFLRLAGENMVAPKYGDHNIKAYFNELAKQSRHASARR